jgi:hypothetical protein
LQRQWRGARHRRERDAQSRLSFRGKLYDARSGEWTADYGKRARSVIEKFMATRESAAA